MSFFSLTAFADCTEDTTPPADVTLQSSAGLGENSAGFCVGGIVHSLPGMPLDVAGFKAYGCEGSTCITRTEYPAQYSTCGIFTPVPGVTINGLTTGTAYNFVITAYDVCGNETPYSNEVTFTTTGSLNNQPPSIPQNINSINPTETSINIMWDESTDPENHSIAYNVRYREVGGTWVDNGNVPGVLAYLTDLNPGTEYEVQVRSFDQELAYSDYSASAFETTLEPSGPLSCTTDSIESHFSAGRAYTSKRKYYATGSNDYLGRKTSSVVSLSETSANYYEKVGSCE